MTTSDQRRKEIPRGSFPDRRPVNGHYPDCPYGHLGGNPDTCGICQAITKGKT